MKLSDIKRVRHAVEQGATIAIEDTLGMEGLKLQVRGLGNNDFSVMYGELTAALPADKRDATGMPVEAERARIQLECLKRTCLLGWNLDDEFTPANVDAAFADPDMGKTWEQVLRYAAWKVGEDAKQEQDAAAKN